MTINKLHKKIFFEGDITIKTGMSIGSSSTGLEIGGADKVVVRNPLTNQPYIPGSSLKGKMRSLLEKLDGQVDIQTDNEGKIKAMPCKCSQCFICQVFGVAVEEKNGIPARLIVRDSELINVKELEESKNTDMPFTEVKTEVVIDRITSQATPRNFERVPAGSRFALNMVCNIYEKDNEQKIIAKIFEGLSLVQDDYIGGSGSRGYGQIKFNITSIAYKDQNCYETNQSAMPNNSIAIPEELVGEALDG